MESRAEAISDRLLAFAASVIRLAPQLSRSMPGRHIAGQLVRSSSSAGANYQEACGAESRADFVRKMQFVLTELRESRYWLNLASAAGLATVESLQALLGENEQLIRIIARSLITAKSRARRS